MQSLALAGLAALLIASVTSADEPTALSAASAETSKSDDASRRPEGPIAKKYEQIRAEFEAQQAAFRQPSTRPIARATSGRSPGRGRAIWSSYYSRRMVDLAESSPDDPAARDALLWVIDKPGIGDMGAYGDEVRPGSGAARPPSW